uniref:Uncharacterized protein n=1 Tax=Anopheles coluzzii TaxID=1518534 RepID=A0A8W7P8E2_ANOCL
MMRSRSASIPAAPKPCGWNRPIEMQGSELFWGASCWQSDDTVWPPGIRSQSTQFRSTSVQAIDFQISYEHSVSLRIGSSMLPGKGRKPCWRHCCTSLRAAMSDCCRQLRNSSVGRLLKLLQNDSPSQPSSHGSSTATGEAKHICGHSTKFVVHSFAYVVEQRRRHRTDSAFRQQCCLAESIPIWLIRDTSFELAC